MTKQLRRQIIWGLVLILLSCVLYAAQVGIFHAERDTFFYLFQDLAFVPIQLLLVTVIVDQVLRMRERMALLKKLNMVIGVFFSEVGTGLLRHFIVFDAEAAGVRDQFQFKTSWDDKQFARAIETVRAHAVTMDHARGDLGALKEFLVSKRGFLLNLLENQSLLEHDTFTDLLWAVFHLMEELDQRQDVSALSHTDGEHIAGDIKRAYVVLLTEWLSYLRHLKSDYPYLYSLAVRTNPFDPGATVNVK
ncbi:MAG: hypothetical protein M0042_07910 [Nitrospiraceae bacterium]|nr:hypothetical protein [Nitrospiraceae bacterium]